MFELNSKFQHYFQPRHKNKTDNIEDAVRGEYIYAEIIGDRLDGCITIDEVIKHTNKVIQLMWVYENNKWKYKFIKNWWYNISI